VKAIRINNAAWIPAISEHIEQFCKRAHVDGIQAGNLQTYFAQIAQMGHTWGAEFWVVFDDADKPCAFACWQVSPLPNIAKVYALAIHSWAKGTDAADMLVDEFIRFGEGKNARWWSADFVGKANVKLFKSKLEKKGFSFKESSVINCVFKRG
jgi:hypothetical protein